jgi:ubiquinone/menaquinone biosynthesis C-methylase UbiE
MHSEARYYDVLAWLLTLGRERALRERLTELAGLRPGESVLDVGCGTGTLAIVAKHRVESSGAVVGIDASPEMIERAKRKAIKAGAEVRFQIAVVEALPFPDASFDVVFSTLMLHHLPRPVREQCAREMRRVVKPDGRIVAVDFATPARERKGLFARIHRHGHMALRDIVALLTEAGLRVKEFGAVGVSDLQFVVACAPKPDASEDFLSSTPTTRSLDPLPVPPWIWSSLVVAVLVAHSIIFRGAVSRLTLSVAAITGLVALFAVMHSGFVGVFHTLLRHRKR